MQKLFGLLVLLALGLARPPLLRAEIVERVAAVINNDVITLSELDEVVTSIQGSALASIADPTLQESKRQEMRKLLLGQMIDQRLLTQLYDKLQISASEQDIEAMIDAICKQNSIARDGLKAELERQGIAYQDYRDQIRQHVLQGKFVEQQIRPRISISEEDLKNLYTRKLGELEEDEVVELSGVLVTIARGGGPEAVEAALRQARVAREELKGGVSPDEVARSATDGSVRSLGNMGAFRRGELMPQLDEAVFALKPGELTEPIETSQGLYLLRVNSVDRRTAASAKPYQEVRDQLYRRLYDQQVETQLQTYVRNARREAHVEVLLQ